MPNKADIPGTKKPELRILPQIKDRISFLYLEHCVVNRDDGAITVRDVRGTVYVPAAALSVLLLGPGTNITHRAVELIGDTGVSIIWVGENGVRYYAHGRALTNNSALLLRQAGLVSNLRSRAAVAKKMYGLRFPDEDVSSLTMQQLRGREGARIRNVYRNEAKKFGIQWSGREYDPDDFDSGDRVNRALSSSNVCLYGIAHSVITALGCSPGLGFVHTGHERSFVYDIADLYKAEITIPLSFETAAGDTEDVAKEVRRRLRDSLSGGHILERMVRDIRWLFSFPESELPEIETDVLNLWDDKEGNIASGVSYGKSPNESVDDETEGYGDILEAESDC